MDPAAAAHQEKHDAEASLAGPTLKPFAAVLQEHRDGVLHAELSEKLAELVRAVAEEDKSGTLTLGLRVGPGPMPGSIVISPTVTSKVPTPPLDAALFFHDDSGNLSRRDPRQPELPIVHDASRA